MINILDIYFSITCMCHKFIESSIVGSNIQGIMPTTMLVYLVIDNSFVSDVYMDDISKIKCQVHHLHLDQLFIQPRHDENCRHLF